MGNSRSDSLAIAARGAGEVRPAGANAVGGRFARAMAIIISVIVAYGEKGGAAAGP